MPHRGGRQTVELMTRSMANLLFQPGSLPPYFPPSPLSHLPVRPNFPSNSWERPSIYPPTHLAKCCHHQPYSIPPYHMFTKYFLDLSWVFLTASASPVAQTMYDLAHNVTPITGTWSSGFKSMTTSPVHVFHMCFFFVGTHHTSPNSHMCSQTPKPSLSLRILVSLFIVCIISYF